MAANNYQFIQTRNMFREYLTGYPEKPTYEEWKASDPEVQAVLLFVVFYQEVTLAWYNAITSRDIAYVTQEDGISIVLQYLMKNVDYIMEDESKYSSRYIYRVCYNCIGCLPRTDREKQRDMLEMSNEYTDGDIELDLWDIIPSEDDDFETQQVKEAIWAIIRHMGPKAEKVVNHLINPNDTLNKVSKKSKAGAIDRLADVSVSEEEYNAIIAELKVRLAPYRFC